MLDPFDPSRKVKGDDYYDGNRKYTRLYLILVGKCGFLLSSKQIRNVLVRRTKQGEFIEINKADSSTKEREHIINISILLRFVFNSHSPVVHSSLKS